MSPIGRHDAERMIARLLAERAFRADLRRDPRAACAARGFEALADVMALAGGPAPQALDVRESRSSLAGVLVAAAVEGAGAGVGGPDPSAARGAASAADAMAGAFAAPDGAGGAAAGAVREALRYLGTPYVAGGETPAVGFDCSGLVQWAYARQDIAIPRTTYEQIGVGTAVARDRLLPGDLVFFRRGNDVHHVGMSLGADRFVHSPHTGDVVKVSSLEEPGYASEFAGGRRLVAPRPGGVLSTPGGPPSAAAGDGVRAEAVRAAAAAPAPAAHETLVFAPLPAASAGPRAATMTFLPIVSEEPRGAYVEAASFASPSATYPGDGAPQRAIAAWMGDRAAAAGLPPELPVMAALQESSLRNLPYGSGDAVGYFQMVRHLWSRDYWGYPEQPELQMRWFVDQASAVRAAAVARGDGDYGEDPATWGAWIAAFERPAAAYRDRYQPHLATARSLLRAV